jgi:putative endonuclease
MDAFVYILRCSDGTLYTGWTVSLEKRTALHNEGKASRYTRARLPVEMAYWEKHEGKEAAMKREGQIKRLSRAEKMALCQGFPETQ